MSADFFSKPILNSSYTHPGRHWELDKQGQPTQQVIGNHRPAEFISPIQKPKKRVIFGELDIDILKEKDGKLRVNVKEVDVFKPQTGEVISDGAKGIACWLIDTDYNEESFFVRHAYFLGANDPYSALKTTLKAEIDPEAWATLNSDTSCAFDKTKPGRLAVKVIHHLGNEVMKVFKVS